MTSADGSHQPSSGDEDPPWIGRRSWFRTVTGYREATDLLNDPRLHSDMAALFRGAGAGAGEVGDLMEASLLSLNGDEHRRLRSVVAPWFTPRAVEQIRLAAADAATERAECLPLGGGCEFMAAFASPFVTETTCRFVGFDIDDVADGANALRLMGDAAGDLTRRGDDWDRGSRALIVQARRALEGRRRDGRNDILTHIVQAVDEGEMSEQVAVALVVTLLSAGQEPTTFQLGLMVTTLSAQPDVWDGVASGTQPVAKVVEETLRYRSTNQAVFRTVIEAFEYRGFQLRAELPVLIELAASNHDPRKFEQPHAFDIDANGGSHLAFGFGPHYCLGAALARLQLQEALQAMATRFRCPTVDDLELVEASGLRGPRTLRLALERR